MKIATFNFNNLARTYTTTFPLFIYLRNFATFSTVHEFYLEKSKGLCRALGLCTRSIFANLFALLSVWTRFVVVFKSACFSLRTENRVASSRTEVWKFKNWPQIIILCDFTRFFKKISVSSDYIPLKLFKI